MPSRALSTARTVTATAVAATALGTAVLGVHLATDHAAARAAPGSQSPTGLQGTPEQQDGSGLLGFSGFGLVQPPGAGSGGSHSSTRGS